MISNEESGYEAWLLNNVFKDLPVIGAYLKEDNMLNAHHEALKCIAALSGGTFMMFNIEPQPHDAQLNFFGFANSAVNMAVGMALGKISYNVARSGGNLLFSYGHKLCCKPRQQTSVEAEVEAETEARRITVAVSP